MMTSKSSVHNVFTAVAGLVFFLISTILITFNSHAGSLIVIRVRDSNNLPLDGVEVFFNDKPAGETNKQGRLTKEGPSGTINLTLKKEGYEAISFKQNCPSSAVCSVKLQKLYPKKIPITFELGGYGHGVQISAHLLDSKNKTIKEFKLGTVGKDGSTKERMHPGNYKIIVNGPYVEKFTTYISLSNNQKVPISVKPTKSLIYLEGKPNVRVCFLNETFKNAETAICKNTMSQKRVYKRLVDGRYYISASAYGIGPPVQARLELDSQSERLFISKVKKLVDTAYSNGDIKETEPQLREAASFVYRHWLQVGLAAIFAFLFFGIVFILTTIKKYRRTHDADGTPLDSFKI